MITNYVHPHSTITQILRATPPRLLDRLNTLIVGPQYHYENPTTDEEIVASLSEDHYAAAGMTIPYLTGGESAATLLDLSEFKVDPDSVRLFASELAATVSTVAEGDMELDLDRGPNFLKAAAVDDKVSTATPADLVPGLSQNIEVGDTVVVTRDEGGVIGTKTYVRKVVSLVAEKETAAFSPNAIPGTGNITANGATALASVSGPSYLEGTAALSGQDVVDYKTGFAKAGGRALVSGNIIPVEDVTIEITSPSAGAVVGDMASRVSFAHAGGGYYSVASHVIGADVGGTRTVSFVLADSPYGALTFEVEVTAATFTQFAVGEKIRLQMQALGEPVSLAPAITGSVAETAPSTTYVVEVVEGDVDTGPGMTGAVLRVYDLKAKDVSTEVTFTGANIAIPLGTSGLSLLLEADLKVLYTGDVTYIEVAPGVDSATEFTGVQLNGAVYNPHVAGSQVISVKVQKSVSGEVTDALAVVGSAFSAGASGITINPLAIDGTPCEDGHGRFYASYRAVRLPAALEGPIEIADTSDLSQLGQVVPQNLLGYGSWAAIRGSGGKRIFALRTAGNEPEDYTEALAKVDSTDIYYSFAALSTDPAVHQVMAAHVEAMSQPSVQNFRRCYCATDSPGEYTFVDRKSSDGQYRLATVDAATLQMFVDGDEGPELDFVSLGVAPGDLVQFVGDDAKHLVQAVTGPHTLTLAEAVVGKTSPSAFIIRKADTPQNTALFVRNTAKAISSRRAPLVWCDDPTDVVGGSTAFISSVFLACEIAGLRSSLLPQQGMTRRELVSVQAAPSMYLRYNDTLLNSIAADGVMIVHQASEGGEIFIRHQLTTETNEGALQWEDSPGVTVDFLSFQVKDAFNAFIGRKNVTPRTISQIEDELQGLMNSATQETVQNLEVGPMLISFANEEGEEGQVTVRVDDRLKDRVITYSRVRIPLPLNNLDHYIDGEVSLDFGVDS